MGNGASVGLYPGSKALEYFTTPTFSTPCVYSERSLRFPPRYSLKGKCMSLLSLAYAFVAGMAATVNPCGFVMLPTLVSFYLGTRDAGYAEKSVGERAVAGIVFGLLATLGFVALFGVVGIVVGMGGQVLAASFPVIGLTIGIILVLLGVWLLFSGRSFGIGLLHRIQPPKKRGPRELFLFGMAYAAASLGCTLPIFLVVVGGALASSGIIGALFEYVSYALGMGIVLTIVSVAMVLSQGFIVHGFHSLLPYVERIGAALMAGAGAYLIVYWWPHVLAPLS